jgi:foldase protein PrsA
VAAKGKGRGPAGRGKRPTGKGKAASADAGGRRRKPLWLAVFGVALVAIFVIFAVAQGIGAPSVPSGDAAVVKDTPSGAGDVSEAEVKRTTAQQIAAQLAEGKLKKAPKPGTKKFEEAQEGALGELLDQIWIKAEAEELGITTTPKQIEAKLKEIKKQQFPTAKAYGEFLKKSHLNQEDVNVRLELTLLSEEIQATITAEAGAVTPGEIQAYYEKEKATQFTTPASRDVRVVVNKDEKQVEAAKKLIEAGKQSDKAWEEAAKKYSSDPTTKDQGGLQKAITEEFVKGDLKKAIFGGATGELNGPVEFEKNFLLIEPVKINAAKVKTLAEVKSQVSQTLTQQKQQEFFNEFVARFQTKWPARTYCAKDFVGERCANYPSSAQVAKAREAAKYCFAAEPSAKQKKEQKTNGCQAAVLMNTPAIPGSVSTTDPHGEQKVQRPRPEGLKEGEGEGALPEAVSPESEAATGEAPPAE